jgi:hypothetical protein|uniref:Uncharacterized protein n=1 Tax=Picea sitchensis TaxID=3332 RepID=A0A6B9XZC7_PICSI|nr:hypothetical protein Q903MT_gene6863 [Picea sitchensis]
MDMIPGNKLAQELELSLGKLSVSLLGVKLLHMDPALRSSPPLSMAHWR